MLTPQGIPVLGCEDVAGPHLMPAFVKTASFQDTKDNPGYGLDKWKIKGEFNLSTGVHIDPDSEAVKVILNQAGPAPLYEADLTAGSFVQKGSTTKPNWRFKDKEGDVPGAVGLRKVQAKLQLNKVLFSIDGRKVVIPIDLFALRGAADPRAADLRIGDDCTTSVLRCALTANGSPQVTSAP